MCSPAPEPGIHAFACGAEIVAAQSKKKSQYVPDPVCGSSPTINSAACFILNAMQSHQ
jgi:hypothetical protein